MTGGRPATNRRGILAGTGSALSAVLGGCLGRYATPSGNRTEVRTSTQDGCEPSARLRPTPDSREPKRYPAYPDSVTASSARAFATAYERAYRYNSKVIELGEAYVVDVSANVPDRAVRRAERGYEIGVDTRVQWDPKERDAGGGSETELPSGFSVFHVWYHLTDRLARRGEPAIWKLEEGATPELSGADVVACAGTDG
jgi:hypothetical protein